MRQILGGGNIFIVYHYLKLKSFYLCDIIIKQNTNKDYRININFIGTHKYNYEHTGNEPMSGTRFRKSQIWEIKIYDLFIYNIIYDMWWQLHFIS